MMNEKKEVSNAGHASRAVLQDLRDLYINKILPVEQLCQFSRSGGNVALDSASFNAPPMLMLIGPYSAGKTSFIKYLIGKEFPGERIGPEPTTDKFVAIVNSEEEERVVPGNALTVTPNTPFSGLERFGNGFLTRFEGSQVVGSSILKDMIIVDTPGVLSGEKQKLGRSYDYQSVMEWFAERSDMIILMFDVQKLDISDEMDTAIKSLSKHYDKVRVVLNKADSLSHQNVVKVYGALMWNLGRVITTPEVTKLYIGSFWDEPLKNEETKKLMEKEMSDLMTDLSSLPRLAAVRKINDMVRRIRQVRVVAILLDYLRHKMPMFGKGKKKKEMIQTLPAIFKELMKLHDLSPGDFPEIEKFKTFLETADISAFPRSEGKKMKNGERLEDLSVALKVAMPDLLHRLPGITSTKGDKKQEVDLLCL